MKMIIYTTVLLIAAVAGAQAYHGTVAAEQPHHTLYGDCQEANFKVPTSIYTAELAADVRKMQATLCKS